MIDKFRITQDEFTGMSEITLKDDHVTRATETTPKIAAKKNKNSFQEGDFVVYAAHGVGRVDRIYVDEIAGIQLEIIQISFPSQQMVLRIPLNKAHQTSLRKVATREVVDKALSIIKEKPHSHKGMWTKRAMIYQEKIRSGDLIQIAEVLRDLCRNIDHINCNFSERKLFESAQERFVTEVAILEKKDPDEILENLTLIIKTCKNT